MWDNKEKKIYELKFNKVMSVPHFYIEVKLGLRRTKMYIHSEIGKCLFIVWKNIKTDKNGDSLEQNWQ
jgi:hypothetical protein